MVSGETDQRPVAVRLPGTTVTSATEGGVASYRRPKGVAAATFPALSTHEPATDAFALSGPPYEPRLQLAIPDMSSTPAKPTVSPCLSQPRASGGRDGVPA